MKTRSFRVDRLDIPAFTQDNAQLAGEFKLTELSRLRDLIHPEAAADAAKGAVTWQATGEVRTPRGGTPQTWLQLETNATVPLTCQRCLQQVDESLALDLMFRFVADEKTAAEMDADAEEDVLVSSHVFDLAELIEDELLLALPLSPTHDECPDPPPASAGELAEPETDERPHPFAALAALKKPGASNT